MLFIGRVIFAALLVVGVLGGVASYHAYRWYEAQPWQEQLQSILEYRRGQSSVFYDAQGEVMQESYSFYQKPTPYEQIPKPLIAAVLATEDQHFFTHPGIDLGAILRAAYENMRAGGIVQGGSTITQQLVRSYLLARERLFSRKIREAILALKLERILSKEEILERYLNHLFLGQNSYGVAGAAQRFFSRPLDQLQWHQHALLAGLFQAPSRYNPLRYKKRALARRQKVLRALRDSGRISRKTYRIHRKKPLDLDPSFEPHSEVADHHRYYLDFAAQQARELLDVSSLKDRGYRIHTYLDRSTSNLLQRSIKAMDDKFTRVEQLNTSHHHNPRLEAAGIVMNVRRGTVEAMVGGRDYSQSKFNRAVQAQRALGSAFKPIVYSYGLLQGYRWSDVFYIAPITLADTYRPRSPGHQYLKESTLLGAFIDSINVTSLELGKKLGMNAIIEHAQRLGMSSPIKKEYGSLIGQSEVNLLEMTRLYSTFAAGGQRVDPVVVARIEDHTGKVLYEAPARQKRTQTVLSAEVNYLMVQAMSKVLSHGTGRHAYSLAGFAGGKTGTTNDATNNWFCGFSQDYVVVVWVGTDASTPLLRGSVSGARLALPIWKPVMSALSSAAGTQPMEAPSGVVSLLIDPRFGHLSSTGIRAWFLKNALPAARPSSLTLIHTGQQPLRGFGSAGKGTSL